MSFVSKPEVTTKNTAGKFLINFHRWQAEPKRANFRIKLGTTPLLKDNKLQETGSFQSYDHVYVRSFIRRSGAFHGFICFFTYKTDI